ncbi:hypothetical protein ABWK57_02615 [Streptomyces sp. NPDC094045]|uniref:hypothetical protein n=1 Tax=Streptomyces sp. NPDC094045 TaxID=3161019 RepID=UPI003391B6EB
MNAPMTPERLAEILARADAALPGPWCTDAWEIYQGTEYEAGAEWIGETARGVAGAADLEQDRATAAFVAAARTDVPDLVAAVELLAAEVAGLRAQVAELEGTQGSIPRFSASEIAQWQARRVEDPHDSPLHHDYALGRDLPSMTADEWNRRYPVGTPVLAYPGSRDAEPLDTVTRTPAWTLGHGSEAVAVVSVEGATGGIRLAHVDPVGGAL